MCFVFQVLEEMRGAVSLQEQRGSLLIETEKLHSVKHAPNDIIPWTDTENMSCEGPETNHKKWVKGQGGKTNQSETSNKTMMNHSLRKEASALLCEAIEGDVYKCARIA